MSQNTYYWKWTSYFITRAPTFIIPGSLTLTLPVSPLWSLVRGAAELFKMEQVQCTVSSVHSVHTMSTCPRDTWHLGLVTWESVTVLQPRARIVGLIHCIISPSQRRQFSECCTHCLAQSFHPHITICLPLSQANLIKVSFIFGNTIDEEECLKSPETKLARLGSIKM